MKNEVSNIKNFKLVEGGCSEKGFRLLASFNVTANGIYIIGCTMSEGPDGLTKLAGPRGTTHKGHKVMAHFEDFDLSNAILDRAAAIYEGITGRRISVGYRVKD